MSGYIKLFRKFEEWYGFSSSKRVHLWITLLMKATHKEILQIFNGKPITLKPGQLLISRKSLSATTKISESYIENLLNEFEDQDQIQQQKTNTNRLITILAWEEYQSCDNGSDNGSDNKKTTKRQQKDTNKNDKNDKNNNIIISEPLETTNPPVIKTKNTTFTPPTPAEVSEYCSNNKYNIDAEHFVNYYAARGWMLGKNKIKDWKACVRTWTRNQRKDFQGYAKNNDERSGSWAREL